MVEEDPDAPHVEPPAETPAEPSAEHEGDTPNCLNCGHAVDENFCPRCGQKNSPRRVGIGHFAREALGETFELDGRVFRTVVPFLFRPGFLTREYNAGRRASYVSPFRLFLACTLLWVASAFLSSNLLPAAGETSAEDEEGLALDAGSVSVGAGQEAEAGETGERSFVRLGDEERLDGKDDSEGPQWELLERFQERADELNELKPSEQRALFFDAVVQALPKAALLLVPVFALLLKLLHLGTGRYYVEHLAFALHVSAFGFLLVAGRLWIGDENPLSLVGLALGFTYLWVALAKAYEARWWSAGLRAMTVSLVYGVTLAVATGLATLLTIFL